jgi:hypothetical protein
MQPTTKARLLELMARHGIAEFSYAGPDGEVRLSDADARDDHPAITAKQAGRFFSQHPSRDAEAAFPRSVQRGDIVGYLKIGPLLLPVVSEQEGVLSSPLPDDGAIAGFGERLY